MSRLRVAFFGSPDFAVPVLDALHAEFDVVLVTTQPDRPAGRGMRVSSPAAARRAQELGLSVAQPGRLRRDEGFSALLREIRPDVAVTAAYGQILPQGLLDIPEHGFLNVHASLLPHLRGAAPIQWALIRGDTETGITIMQTEAGLDTGPVRHQVRTQIGAHETAPELFARLSVLGATAITEALRLLGAGRLPSVPQDDSRATHAPMLKREDGLLDFTGPAPASYNRFRGVFAWPGTFFRHLGSDIKVHALSPRIEDGPAPGTVLSVDSEGVSVAAARGSLLLQQVQAPGKRRMHARDWANGAVIRPGDMLS